MKNIVTYVYFISYTFIIKLNVIEQSLVLTAPEKHTKHTML